MWVFKPKYRDTSGKQKEGKRWWVGLRDHTRIERKFPAFTSKAASETLGRQIEKLVAAKINGGGPGPELSRWLREVPRDLQERLVKVGLIDGRQAAAGKPLAEHVADFVKSLEAKDRAPKHVKQVRNVLVDTFTACGFVYWHDICASRLEGHLADLRDRGRGISARTFNHKLKSCQQFARWMVKNRRASESPIAHLSGLNVKTDRRRVRRALAPDDIRRLLSVTKAAGIRFGLTGYERYLVYRLCCETGIRAGEVRTLRVDSFDFENRVVAVQAGYSKRRRYDVLPLRSDTAVELQRHFAGKTPRCQAFAVPERTADMLKADLIEADIPYEQDGQVFDFHSLRHETGTLLAASGTHPKVAQSILRHSSIDLTLSVYSHTLIGQETQAVESLPDLSVNDDEKQQKTA